MVLLRIRKLTLYHIFTACIAGFGYCRQRHGFRHRRQTLRVTPTNEVALESEIVDILILGLQAQDLNESPVPDRWCGVTAAVSNSQLN